MSGLTYRIERDPALGYRKCVDVYDPPDFSKPTQTICSDWSTDAKESRGLYLQHLQLDFLLSPRHKHERVPLDQVGARFDQLLDGAIAAVAGFAQSCHRRGVDPDIELKRLHGGAA